MSPRTLTVAHALRQGPALGGTIAALMAALVVGLVVGALWWPVASAQAAADGEASALLDELRSARSRADRAAIYHARLAAVEELEAKLEASRSEPDFVAEIEALAERSGTELLQFSSRRAASGEASSFEFFVRGSYPATKALLGGLADLSEHVTVRRVVLERSEDGVRTRVLLGRGAASRQSGGA